MLESLHYHFFFFNLIEPLPESGPQIHHTINGGDLATSPLGTAMACNPDLRFPENYIPGIVTIRI